MAWALGFVLSNPLFSVGDVTATIGSFRSGQALTRADLSEWRESVRAMEATQRPFAAVVSCPSSGYSSAFIWVYPPEVWYYDPDGGGGTMASLWSARDVPHLLAILESSRSFPWAEEPRKRDPEARVLIHWLQR